MTGPCPNTTKRFGSSRGTAQTYYNRGMAWHAQHEYDRAIVEFDEALRLKENCVYSFYMRGRVWEKKGECDRAIKDFDDAIARNPTFALAFAYRGRCWYRKGELDRARKDMAEAFRLDATTRDGFCDAGRYWCNQGDYARAIEELDHAVRFNPTPDAFVCRGWAKSCVGDHEAALADFDEAIRLDPTSAKAFCCRGVTKFQMKNYAGAGATSTRPFASIPRWRVLISTARACMWKPESSIRHGTITSSTSTSTRRTSAAFNAVAWELVTCPDAQWRDGRKALRYATRACDLSDWKDAASLDTLAVAYAEVGDFDLAIRWAKEALTFPEQLTETTKADVREHIRLFEQKIPLSASSAATAVRRGPRHA